MLSGDRLETVSHVAEQLGIEDYRAQWSPQSKAAHITALRAAGRKVLVVGDGLNDAPALAAGTDLRGVFFEDLNTMAGVVRAMPGLLTVAEYQDEVLSGPLTPELDPEALSTRALALLWNVTALAYMFLTNRWYEAVAPRFGEAAAQALEKEVWLERGAAEDDLRIGLEAARASGGDVETLLKGFQLAPGEVGLLEVDFDLQSADHGWLIHRRCPAWDRFGNRDPARREHSCVICVIGMRLSGEMIDPRIRCRPASLPPHRQPRDHACKWEYWLEPGEEDTA